MAVYEITYDYFDSFEYTMCGEVFYDYVEEKNCVEFFHGSWNDLQDYIKVMRDSGKWSNISACAVNGEDM